jgi:NAD(P)-dependent dehydrogenase (short-subunit alcohol dehydrogenase family)
VWQTECNNGAAEQAYRTRQMPATGEEVAMAQRVALITGAGSGVGRAAALVLLAGDWKVFLVGRREAALASTKAEAGERAAQAVVAPADVGAPASVASLFEAVGAQAGRLDLVFNNAGTNVPAVPFDELTYEQWTTVLSVNLTGAFLVAQAAFRLMKSQRPKGGRIINNGSVSAHVPRPNSAPYTASKHAITGLTKSLSLDGREHDIACGQIDIGNAETEMASATARGARQANGTMMPEPMIDPRHVADAVAYMAGLPLDANVQFITVMATKMPFIGRG